MLAAGVVLLTAAARWLLRPLLGDQLVFAPFFFAVFVAAWAGGLGPALFATFASLALALVVFIPPADSLVPASTVGTIGAVLFVAIGVIAALLGESRLRAQARAEAAQRAAEAHFRAMAESSPLGIFVTNATGDCMYTNRTYQQISGLSPEQALGTGWSQAIHPEDRAQVFQEWYDTAQRRVHFRSEHRFAHADGRVVWTRVNAAEVKEGQRLVGYVGLVEDITQQVAAQAALQQSEERYRAFIEQTAEGVWRFELENPVPIHLPADEQIERFYADAYLAECNDAVAHMYGYANAAQMIGTRLADMMPRTDQQNLEYLRAFIRSGYRLTDAESHEFDRDGRE
ncbi:MAG TPA: PAS domain S-box protein, partial [Gemmatimonadales bacterium]